MNSPNRLVQITSKLISAALQSQFAADRIAREQVFNGGDPMFFEAMYPANHKTSASLVWAERKKILRFDPNPAQALVNLGKPVRT
jgi:hypothetical protein